MLSVWFPMNLGPLCVRCGYCNTFRSLKQLSNGFPIIEVCTTSQQRLLQTSSKLPEQAQQSSLAVDGWEPWEKKGRKILIDGKNIIIDDLAATLQAHRTANRAAVVRRVDSDAKHPSLDSERSDQQPTEDNGQPPPVALEPLTMNQPLELLMNASGEDQHSLQNVNTSASTKMTDNASKRPVKKTKEERLYPWSVTSPQIQKRTERQENHYRNLSFDYKAKLITPQGCWKRNEMKPQESANGSLVYAPWLSLIKGTDGSGLARLNAEIKAYEKYMSLDESELRVSELLKLEMSSIIRKVLPGAALTVHGSYDSGLATPVSDVDFSLSLPIKNESSRTEGARVLKQQSRRRNLDALKTSKNALAISPSFHQCEFLRKASVPIVKAVHRPTNKTIEIKIASTELPYKLYKADYLSEFSTLRPLYVLLKSSLQLRGLDKPFGGGLGSYSVFMMVVYALKTCPPDIGPENIALQLLHILRLFSDTDLCKYGFSIDPPYMFEKLLQPPTKGQTKQSNGTVFHKSMYNFLWRHQPYLMCLLDPVNPLNDLGIKAYGIKHIQAFFGHARGEVKKLLRERKDASGPITDRVDKGLLYPLVGADYEYFEKEKKSSRIAAEHLRKTDMDLLSKQLARQDRSAQE